MQLGPGRHEPQLPNVHAALDDLDLIDPDLRLPIGMPSMKVRIAVIVVVHSDHDPIEARNRRHVVVWCRSSRSSLRGFSRLAGANGRPPTSPSPARPPRAPTQASTLPAPTLLR